MTRDRGLLVPGIEAAGLHADRNVEIKPDLEAELGCLIAAGTQLPVGGPLHELDEFDFSGVFALAQLSAVGVVGAAPFGRPLPPWLVEPASQRLKAGKARQ